MTLLGDVVAGPISAAASSVLQRQSGQVHLVFSAVRNGTGALQVISYEANLD